MTELSNAAGQPAHGRRPGIAAAVVLGLLRAYKILISPLFAGSCRFQPSCSEYMAEAVRVHGALAGTWLGIRRLIRCVPFGGYGLDLVPHKHCPHKR